MYFYLTQQRAQFSTPRLLSAALSEFFVKNLEPGGEVLVPKQGRFLVGVRHVLACRHSQYHCSQMDDADDLLGLLRGVQAWLALMCVFLSMCRTDRIVSGASFHVHTPVSE